MEQIQLLLNKKFYHVLNSLKIASRKKTFSNYVKKIIFLIIVCTKNTQQSFRFFFSLDVDLFYYEKYYSWKIFRNTSRMHEFIKYTHIQYRNEGNSFHEMQIFPSFMLLFSLNHNLMLNTSMFR